VLEKPKRRKKRSLKAINGRLNRWSFRKFQSIVDYEVKLTGLNVRYIDAGGTSSLCSTRGGKLSPNGYRRTKRHTCRLEEDRDKIAVKTSSINTR